MPRRKIPRSIDGRVNPEYLASYTLSTEGKVVVVAITGKDSKGNPLVDFPSLTPAELEKAYVPLGKATELLGLAYPAYTRRLVAGGTVEALKVAIRTGTKWVVSVAGIEKYRTRIRAPSGLRNYTLRIPPEKEKAIRTLLDGSGVEYTLALSFTPKEG